MIRCSFCGRGEDEVKRMIATPDNARAICDACTKAAKMALDDRNVVIARCPSCKRIYPMYYGIGVTYCDPCTNGCGHCVHNTRTNGVCDLCGNTKRPSA